MDTMFLMIIFFVVATLNFLVYKAFYSFSKVSLAGFCEDCKKMDSLDLLKNYDVILYDLSLCSFIFQILFFYFTYKFCLNYWGYHSFKLALLILFGMVIYFYVLLSIQALKKKEFILRFFLSVVSWNLILAFPLNILLKRVMTCEENEASEQDDISERELEVFLAEGAKEGVIEHEDKEMLESVLEFGDTLVKNIMTPRVDMSYIDIESSIEEVIALIDNKKRSRYPVVSKSIDHIEGIILSKDVIGKLKYKDFKIEQILRPAYFVPETMRIIELLKEMQKQRQKFAVVVDEFGGVSGLLTMEDIIEEIVGDIQDEYDNEEKIIEKLDSSSYIVKGDVDIYQLGEELGEKIREEEDYQTIAGFISYELGRIPVVGDTVFLDSYGLEVLEMDKNRILKIKIYKDRQESEFNE